MEHEFQKILQEWNRRKLLAPIAWYEELPLYSTFQIWLVDHILGCDVTVITHEHPPLRGFGRLLRLLLRIQDFYLPEVRGNLRTGLYAEYRGDIILNSSINILHTFLLSHIRQFRDDAIRRRKFIPRNTLKATKLDNKSLQSWIEMIEVYAEHLDPLLPWKNLVRFISYQKRQELRGKARLSQDYYEIVEILTLFARDLGIGEAPAILLDWQYDRYPLQPFAPPGMRGTHYRPWELQKYERDGLARPYMMLEYLTNEFELNPRPLAIVFTEGEEWRGLKRLFIRVGIDPDLLGVEFRSLYGGGNFSVEKWQRFIEYMHEKQVLIYFVLDKENKVLQQREKLLKKERIARVEHLKKVMPVEHRGRDKDRIWVWDRSFEEEFTDQMISRALFEQGICLSRQKICALRRDGRRTKGLIAALPSYCSSTLDKGRLSESLVDQLTLVGAIEKDGRHATRLERFVWESAQQIILNRQPTDAESRRANFKTGLVG